MKLTEAKLKQMILEALKNKRFQDFGIPTPDEKLRADIGDEMYDRIQSVDPEQSEIFKQSFDPTYPSSIQMDSFADILESYGFESKGITFGAKKQIASQTWRRDEWPFDTFTLHISIDPTWSIRDLYHSSDREVRILSRKFPFHLRYNIKLDRNFQDLIKKHEYIPIPKMFDVDLTDEDDLKHMESLVLKREKENIIRALEQLS
jgi:hypothetical protein